MRSLFVCGKVCERLADGRVEGATAAMRDAAQRVRRAVVAAAASRGGDAVRDLMRCAAQSLATSVHPRRMSLDVIADTFDVLLALDDAVLYYRWCVHVLPSPAVAQSLNARGGVVCRVRCAQVAASLGDAVDGL